MRIFRQSTLLLLLSVTALLSTLSQAATILMPTPREGFDPTEVAVPWKVLTEAGHSIVFATPDGRPGQADPIMLTGDGLGPLKGLLANDANGVGAYHEMVASPEYQNPLLWSELRFEDFDALVLGGGHAKEVREYLESEILQGLVSRFFAEDKPVAAICHGVVLAARSAREDGRSVLYNRRTTSLLNSQELLAWKLTKLWMGSYYRTYEITVEDEVKSLLRSDDQFEKGPFPMFRDSPKNLSPGFVIRDGNYLSARWPGDAHRFAVTFVDMLDEAGL